jgi:hypothetical protein
VVENVVVVQSLVLFPDTTLLLLSQEVWGKILGDPDPGPPQTLPPSSVCLSPRLSILSLVLLDLCRGPCSLLALRWHLTSRQARSQDFEGLTHAFLMVKLPTAIQSHSSPTHLMTQLRHKMNE